MSIRVSVSLVAGAICVAALLASPARADDSAIDLEHLFISDQDLGLSSAAQISSSDDAPDYDYGPSCGLGGQAICYGGSPCVENGADGILYDVFLNGEKVGETCVTQQQAVERQQVTPGMVLRAFRSLTWPESELVIQPPGGRTLVNFATNFYTDNTAASQQRVTLLGQEVLIEATPSTYTWQFGDGSSDATSVPGAPYPALDVTHDYASVDTFAPSLDTTYTGRYRLNGGPWIAIPESLTVAGASQNLKAIEARPTLVDY